MKHRGLVVGAVQVCSCLPRKNRNRANADCEEHGDTELWADSLSCQHSIRVNLAVVLEQVVPLGSNHGS
jgi:hypothetical protein